MRRAIFFLLLSCVVVCGCGGKTRSQPATAPHKVGPGSLTATLSAPGHHPKVKRPWRITVTLRWDGRPARGRISYAFVFGGVVVSRQPVRGRSPNFTGVFHDVIRWPANAAGHPLTFRVIVTSAHGTRNLDYQVQAVR